jgi:hypothetical protein
MTKAHLSRLSGVSLRAIDRIYHESPCNVRLSTLRKIAMCMGVPITNLLANEEATEQPSTSE